MQHGSKWHGAGGVAAALRPSDERVVLAVRDPVFARCDPPFMPWFLRRNEIQIEVKRLATR